MFTIIARSINLIVPVMSIIIIVNILLSSLPISIIILSIIGKFRRSSMAAGNRAC
ncbi:hypothetical protein [Sediminispirochaeta smaragdinae]|uniref:Uncharacterized protein n=1 Tax=Sediminispirochaeta smaragdinae (strain DSM 11293 / JCM 15392 / SEBR 4228) TaxID=573413 RepID=E1R5W5_SEDSS|nr:hypothetical protein [Sediminispirochaeta smaragdinae]ADK80730.1 hypothetical protein Spirs_1603 [Sediminispirochaeta smaragdinae DSM 11293]